MRRVTKIDSVTKYFEGVPTPMDCLWPDADAVSTGPHEELLELQLGGHLLERFQRLNVPRVANRPESQFFGHLVDAQQSPLIPVSGSVGLNQSDLRVLQ